MAAHASAGPELLSLRDLRELRPLELAPLLAEETLQWREQLHWDFGRSAELVRRFTEMRGLRGSALISRRGQAVGYCYYILEQPKGLIGNLFVSEEFRSPENEDMLLGATLKALLAAPVERIESQLMMCEAGPQLVRRLRALPGGRQLQVFDRHFMMLDLARGAWIDEPGAIRDVVIEPWSSTYQEATAKMISEVYAGHVDAQINDQYRSLAGARKFLYNIVQYPGCGNFQVGASLVALDRQTGVLCGVCLASLVGERAGHITQLCVAPRMHGRGLGRALMNRCVRLMREQGCRSASLTVTSSNGEALRLYLRAGFAAVRHFPACVWEAGAGPSRAA